MLQAVKSRGTMGLKFYQVDAFTQEPFAGNPAVVCLLEEALDSRAMQNIAKEMNLSETAFLKKQADGYSLRWFTPGAEVDLCGHATLASAHVLWEQGILRLDEQTVFHTRSGVLTAENDEGLIRMDFPALEYEPAAATGELVEALGIEPIETVGFGRKLLFLVENEDEVYQLQPDFSALKKMPGRGVVITSASRSEEYDFISRYFAPWVGVDEDPVTGSNHCCLGPYWGEKLEKQTLTAFQASERGGVIEIELLGERVSLGGHAVTVLRGEFLI
jgi:PhzF family phenazine biosynthesis protein